MKIITHDFGVIECRFTDRKNLALTFCRFQEYYESPEFKGKIFTLNEYKDWYKKQKNGQWTYSTDWGGFNIPKEALIPFLEAKFDPLSKRERRFLKKIKPYKAEYIIGICDGNKEDESIIRHEFFHACFNRDTNYRKIVIDLYKVLPAEVVSKITKVFTDLGYHPSVFIDEFQAYLLDGGDYLLEDIPELEHLPIKQTLQEFVSIGG